MHTVVRLWRASYVLGAEMVGEYVSKAIPSAERAAFWKCAALDQACSLRTAPGGVASGTPDHWAQPGLQATWTCTC